MKSEEAFVKWWQSGGGVNALNSAEEIAKIAFGGGFEANQSVEEKVWPKSPSLIKGGLSVDDRGALSFINDFSLFGFKRFYIIENHDINFIRAWHGHRNEAKAFVSLVGSFLVSYRSLEFDDAGEVDFKREPEDYGKVVLSCKYPSALIVPGGYANGTMNLTPGAKLLVFSSASLEESKTDDIRCECYDKNDYFNTFFENDHPFTIKNR